MKFENHENKQKDLSYSEWDLKTIKYLVQNYRPFPCKAFFDSPFGSIPIIISPLIPF
jgi:hypothetical protein